MVLRTRRGAVGGCQAVPGSDEAHRLWGRLGLPVNASSTSHDTCDLSTLSALQSPHRRETIVLT